MKTWQGKIWIMILVLLAGRMAAQVPVLDSICSGTVRHYAVNGEEGSTYSWILTPPTGPSVMLPGDNDSLEMAWTYPGGIYSLQVIQHGLNGCDADAVFGQVQIFDQPDVYAGPNDIVCLGRTYKLIDATAENCETLQWASTGDGTFDFDTTLHAIYTPGAGDILAGSVTLTLYGTSILGPENGCEPSYSSLVLSIVTEIVPLFGSIGPLCQYSTPPALPDTSLQGMTGYWTPPVINTDFLGTFPYTFSPDNPAQCGVDTTLMITVTDQIVPQFDPIGPLCINSVPPALPDTSAEGITGTWEPPVITTDAIGVYVYTFNPDDPSQCGLVTTIEIAVVNRILPEFGLIGPLCQYSVPPSLPAVSLNGITGTWEPPVITTDLPGTYPYTFTPDSNQCGLVTTMNITVNPQVTPAFEQIEPVCQYTVGPPLPSISLNDIHGTWYPPVIITAWPGTFTYTFTPDPETCGTVYTMEITILPEIIAEFDPIGPLCQFSTPPLLPVVSLNGVTGTWNPPAISTDILGTFFYTFTPDTVFQCAMQVTIVIEVTTEITPAFEPIGPLCLNSVPPALPDTSLEGIHGTWDPAVISTSTVGMFLYSFTPDAGQCADETTIKIIITDHIPPLFDPIGPLCLNSIPPALPDTSLNGLAGVWVPPVIQTSTQGVFTYIFTPDAGQCGMVASIEIEITDQIIPVFDPIGPLCHNSIPPDLPGTSLNGITGTWVPPFIDTSVPGSATYTFTPDAGQCGQTVSLAVEVTDEITPVFEPIGPLCRNTVPPALPSKSLNGITGSWEPPVISTTNTGISTYTFTPDAGQCGVVVFINIEVTEEIIPVFEQIGPLCQYSPPLTLPIVSDNYPAITGTWDPPVVSTLNPGTEIYTFTPDPGQCGSVVTMTIVVNEQVVPVFDPIGPLSQNSPPPTLPGMSLNGITGSWTPSTIDTSIPGTYPYFFTPDSGQCASITDMNITVIFDELLAITGPGKHCLGDAAIVPLEVDKFFSVAGFQLKLSYNADKLWCEGYINLHPQLDGNLTGTVDNYYGIITLNWQSDEPVTFSGKEKICDLVFIPKEPGQGQLAWYTGTTESYFRDLTGIPIPAEFYSNDLTIYQPPEILLSGSKTVCEGERVTILGIASSTYPPVSYIWTYPNGDTTSSDPYFDSVTLINEGDYTLLATDSLGCTDQKTIRLEVSENPVAEFHGAGTLEVYPGYILDAGYGMDSYSWNTGETTESIAIDTAGWYVVTMITQAGCVGIDSVYIVISEYPEECLFIPNAFTPNNDGLNDVFRAVSACPVEYFKMLIFNRWGEMIFESDDISRGWDGTKHGIPCPGDGYVYKITYRAAEIPGDKEKVKVGTVIIVR